MKKSFLAGMLTALVFLCLICTAYATVGKTTWEVDYNDIKIKLRGQEVVPKNSNGEPVEPIAYEGTTYLPVRAVGTALGLDVAWDGNTNTVLLDDPAEQKLEEFNSNMHYAFSGLIHHMSVFREIGLAAIIHKNLLQNCKKSRQN